MPHAFSCASFVCCREAQPCTMALIVVCCAEPLWCRAPSHALPQKSTCKPWRSTVMHHGLEHGLPCRVSQGMPAFCLCASEEMHTGILRSQEPLHGYNVCPWTCQTSCNRHSRPWQPSTKVGTCACELLSHTCIYTGTHACSHAHHFAIREAAVGCWPGTHGWSTMHCHTCRPLLSSCRSIATHHTSVVY